MDPNQPASATDPYQPIPTGDGNTGHVPPPLPDDYTQLTQQQVTPESDQPPAVPVASASQQYAVDWARAKVEAAHGPVGQHPVQPAATQSSVSEVVGAHTEPTVGYKPPEEFENFELPGSQADTAPAVKIQAEKEEPLAVDKEQETVKKAEVTTASVSEEKPVKAKAGAQKASGLLAIFRKDGKFQIPHRLRPVVGAIVSGFAVFAIFNSQVIIGQIQYIINPGTGDSSNVSAALDEKVGPDPLIIIPKINVSAPVVYDVKTFDEQAVQKGLERGVVHYGTTALPGQLGNNVIVGHSSNNWWASGKYKFAFVLLDKLEVGDTFVLNYDSKRYVYEITTKKVVGPKDTSVLSQNTDTPITTLITCTPVGTSLNRLIVVGKQISPNPGSEKPPTDAGSSSVNDELLPGNTPSLIDKFRQWLR